MKRKIVACVCLVTFVVGCSWMADIPSVSVHGSPKVKGRKDQDIPSIKMLYLEGGFLSALTVTVSASIFSVLPFVLKIGERDID